MTSISLFGVAVHFVGTEAIVVALVSQTTTVTTKHNFNILLNCAQTLGGTDWCLGLVSSQVTSLWLDPWTFDLTKRKKESAFKVYSLKMKDGFVHIKTRTGMVYNVNSFRIVHVSCVYPFCFWQNQTWTKWCCLNYSLNRIPLLGLRVTMTFYLNGGEGTILVFESSMLREAVTMFEVISVRTGSKSRPAIHSKRCIMFKLLLLIELWQKDVSGMVHSV